MNRRQYKKKSIHEFCTARTSLVQPISSITSKFSYGDTQESFKLHYISKLMTKSSAKLEEVIIKEKYRIIGGKLHIYSYQSDSYLPVERNNYIDIVKHSERMRNDHAPRCSTTAKDLSAFWATERESFNPKLCSRESERQQKSTMALSIRKNRTSRNFYTSSQKELNFRTPSEMLSERGVSSSYQLLRQRANIDIS